MTYDELVERILAVQEIMLKSNIEANSVTLNGRKYGKFIENCPSHMKPTIFGMAVKADYALPDDYDFLVQYEPPRPKTNADRIRAMTDEELADLFISVGDGNTPEKIVFSARDMGYEQKMWLDWLKKEEAK